MDFLLDTADLSAIKECYGIFKLKGVTTNPSIIANTVKDNPYKALREIWEYLKTVQGELHIQTLSNDKGGIIREAETLVSLYGLGISVKIPATREGLKAIKVLSAEGIQVTATAILSYSQGVLAALNGASSLAVYCNRMQDLGVDYEGVIRDVHICCPDCRILGASFRTFDQVRKAFLSGAGACTLTPQLLLSQLDQRPVKDAVSGFEAAWEEKYGEWSAAALFSVSAT